MSTTISILNDLIETLKDGQEGFRAAAADVKAADLKTIFSEYSLQRSKFVGELQSLSRSLGEKEPETEGSVAGALHRGWINLKAAISSQDEHAILVECERGEDSAVSEYKKAIKENELPANVLEALQTQYEKVKAAHDRIRNLRDSRTSK